MKPLTSIALVLALGSLGSPVGAHAQFLQVGGYGTYNTLSGDDFRGTDAGIGMAGFFRYSMLSGFGLGAGVQINTHNIDGINPNLNVLGIYLEPRYEFVVANSIMKPTLGAKLYWVQQSISEGGDNLKARGFAVGGIGGLLFQLQPQFALEPAVTYTYVSFGDAKFNGTTISNSDSSGSSLGIQVSFVVSFGR